MTFRNRYLFIVFFVVCLVGLIKQWKDHYRQVDDYDAPKQLSGKTEVISLRHVERKCDCADWVEASHGRDSAGVTKDDYMYIEPASAGMDVPALYWALEDSGYVLRLTGQFYKGKSIPYNYTQKTNQKPEKARVFYYTASEVVKPE